MPIVLGIDSSTQSCKAELRDADTGELLASGRSPHPLTTPPASEQAPEAWWHSMVQATRGSLSSGEVHPNDVAALAIDAQCHGLVALDGDGQVIRPAKLWNDTTSAPEASALVAALGVGEWVARTGSCPTAAFTITKVAWLAAHEPENFKRMRSLLTPADWLTFRAANVLVTDRSNASSTCYYSPAEGSWDIGILELIDADRDWQTYLPEVLGPAERAGTLSEQAAAALGLRPGIPVGPGCGDQHASALGLGVRGEDVVFALGTSGVTYSTSRTPVEDRTGVVNGVADASGGFLPLVCTLNATKVTDNFARLLGVDHRELESLALEDSAGALRPVLVPYLDGERTPDLPHATGVLAGLTSSTARADIARAAYEGVLLGLLHGYDALLGAGVPLQGRVLMTGGGALSTAYPQLLSDLLGRVVLPSVEESSARGACIQAAAVLRGVSVTDVLATWPEAEMFEVEPRTGAAFGGIRDHYAVVAGWRGADWQ